MSRTKDLLLCPQCDAPLKSETLHGQAIDRCPNCKCLWLDFCELAPLVRGTDVSGAQTADARLPERPLDCPRCQITMASVEYGGDSKVFVRKCSDCNGTWLAAGQLVSLARYRQGTGDMEKLSWVGELAPFGHPDPIRPSLHDLREDAFDDPQKAKQWIAVRRFWQSPVLVIGVVVAYFAFMWATGGINHPGSSKFSIENLIVVAVLAILACNPIRTAKRVQSVEDPIDALTPGDLVTVMAWIIMLGVMAFHVWMRLNSTI